MTITLYKNSQHEADTSDLIYKDRWSAKPYESESMFCEGETTEQNDFVLPQGITYSGGFLYQNKSPCTLSTNDKGQPVLTASFMPPFVLLTREEQSRIQEEKKQEKKHWVPGIDKNGEWEIF